MSKIAEKRTNEIIGEFHEGDYTDHSRHNTEWIAFKKGYDQAMQDFLEKANRYFIEIANKAQVVLPKSFFEDFKNYMQDEM